MNDKMTAESNTNGLTAETHLSSHDAQKTRDSPALEFVNKRRDCAIDKRILEVELSEIS